MSPPAQIWSHEKNISSTTVPCTVQKYLFENLRNQNHNAGGKKTDKIFKILLKKIFVCVSKRELDREIEKD
jgi:hypothetical protein